MTRAPQALAACLIALAVSVALASPAAAQIEDYAEYRPQEHCQSKAKPGTKVLARWLVRRGGGEGPISRPCKSGGTSEHKEGRAFDWVLDATRKRDRQLARDFLDFAFAEDKRGNTDAKARRMGVMYIIWNDHMYAAWDEFRKAGYLSSSCKSTRKCSRTLRHRDHMHISLSRPGGKGLTSWYDGRVSD